MRWVALIGAVVTVAVVAMVGLSFSEILMPGMLNTGSPFGEGGQPSAVAVGDIPADLLLLYQQAAQTCPGLSWTVLAGIGKVETDHNRDNLPGVHSGQNSAGAMGPMQFLAGTFAAFALPGMKNVYNPRDAIFAAAHYLCSNGAGNPAQLQHAIWLYNHADWYVNEVLDWSSKYLADVTRPVQVAVVSAAVVHAGDPFGGACHPVITQPYGPVDNPLEPIISGRHFHTGIDLACPAGTPIHTLTDGVAHVSVGCVASDPPVPNMCGGGWGNNVVVESQFALPGVGTVLRYFVRYAHLLEPTVSDGQVVHSGQLIGLEGTTGLSTGPHLHFEVDHDTPSIDHSVNPGALLTEMAG